MTLTKNAMDALNASASCAQQFGHDHIGAEHIFLSILAIPQCQACQRLKSMKFALEDLVQSITTMIQGSGSALKSRGQLPLTARTKKILDIAEIEAGGKGNTVGTVHLVQAMLREGENVVAQVLFNAGVGVENFIAAGSVKPENDSGSDEAEESAESGDEEETSEEDVEEAEDSARTNRGSNGKAVKTPNVNNFGRDLTQLARDGKLDPVIGRDKELKRLVQILARRTKNNAVLVGEAGVGKTAVAEGLARAIVSGEVPEKMQNKRVVAIDMARVVAGTQYRGQFEERLKNIIDETKNAGNIILFLDEIHTMVGAGGAEGAMDAANILKPALARGELQCVGATTLKEYHKSIEKDAALERRFQSVQIDEPSVEDTVEILKGIAPRYEEHHSVKYSAAALKAAAELTARYLPGRQLPDKAIDAIDETGARLRMAASARPKALVKLQAEIDSMRNKKDKEVAKGNFDGAATYREAIREASARFRSELAKWKESHAEEVIEATEEDVASTVSSISGVPVEKMSATTAEKLLKIEETLGEVVIAQDEAVKAIAKALRRSRAFLSDPKRPMGSFLFLGPTGVGKTHLAKMLADKIYGDEKALVILDMSEYQEKYSSSRLVGAPPGYVGYDEGGQLTEKVRRRPYSVVLFDEFEKANADVCNMLLQILDDGRLTDGQGRVVDFRNTIIICTANLGFDFAKEGHTIGFATETSETSHEILKEKLLSECKRTFRPELLNRFDEMIVFRKLDKAALGKIVKLEMAALLSRVKSNDIALTVDKSAEEFLVEKGYDSTLGARPLRRIVQEYVEDPLAELVLAGKAKLKMRLKLAKDGKSLMFQTISKNSKGATE